jgi:branched-chain amino acid transport system ATP-binding protein
MLRISNLDVAIGPVPIVRNASLDVSEGEMCGLIGRNGAGKTTLLRALMGSIPASGRIELDDTELLGIPAHRRVSHGIGYMPEDRRLVPEFNVEENILLPAWTTRSEGAGERLQWIFSVMPELAALRQRSSLQLSGGQQKMVALGRALGIGTKCLLLDEPFEGIAPALSARLSEVLASLKEKDLTVLMSQSDMNHSRGLFDVEFVIERGANLANPDAKQKR